jgi:transcriptional regulator with XRE-family HTH domain
MTPNEIKAEIKELGLTQKAIAQKLQRSEMMVSKVINKKDVSDYIMRGVAKAINKGHTKVFPEYYLGTPKRSTSKTVQPYNKEAAA